MRIVVCVAVASMVLASFAGAEDAVKSALANSTELVLAVKDHRFDPERLDVPAGVKFKLLVRNLDDTPEEFESFDLNREKVVEPSGEISVFLGPLDPGEYKFFGDFHQDTAQGVMIAK